MNTSGDGFLAMFDGSQRAIRCPMAIRDAVQALGIEVRAGLHTGECEVRGDDIGGIGCTSVRARAHWRSRTTCWCPSTLRDLVIGQDSSSRSAALTSSRASDPIQQRRRLRCLERTAPLEELVEPGDHLRIRPTTRHVFEHTFDGSRVRRHRVRYCGRAVC